MKEQAREGRKPEGAGPCPRDREVPGHRTVRRGCGGWAGLAWLSQAVRLKRGCCCSLCQGPSGRHVRAVTGLERAPGSLEPQMPRALGLILPSAGTEGRPMSLSQAWVLKKQPLLLTTSKHFPERTPHPPRRHYWSQSVDKEPQGRRVAAEATWPVEAGDGQEPQTPTPAWPDPHASSQGLCWH